MNKNQFSPIFLLLNFLIGNFSLKAIDAPSLNGRTLKSLNSSSFSFYIGGHFYGDAFNKTGLPINTIYSAVDSINSINNYFLVSLGDLFLDPEKDIESYSRTFFKSIKVPIFNAAGNHDVMGGYYEKKFKETYFSFNLGSCAFLFLDAERNDSKIVLDQLEFFKSRMSSFLEDSLIKNVFVFSHRPIWAEGNVELSQIFKFNTRSSSLNNFQSDIEPVLIKLAHTKKVVWCSGSMDVSPASFFYHFDSISKITYIQTAVRGTNHDGILKVEVNGNQIDFKTISLTTQPTLSLPEYNVDFFTKGWSQKPINFNLRLVPLYLKQTFTNRFFWYGCLTAIVSLLIFYFIYNRFKK